MKELKNPKQKQAKKLCKALAHELSMRDLDDSSSGGKDVDFEADIHPLGYYINNREDMIDQMFSVIQGTKLKKMLPPILKDMTLNELKADCLLQLLGMSSKRIKFILAGRELQSSSGSDTLSEPSPPPERKAPIANNGATNKRPIELYNDWSDVSSNTDAASAAEHNTDLDTLEIELNNAELTDLIGDDTDKGSSSRKKRKHHDHTWKKNSKRKIMLRESKGVEGKKSSVKFDNLETLQDGNKLLKAAKVSGTKTNSDKNQGKTLLEILELEMRARAIRALLKQGGSSDAVHDVELVRDEDEEDSRVSDLHPSKRYSNVIKMETDLMSNKEDSNQKHLTDGMLSFKDPASSRKLGRYRSAVVSPEVSVIPTSSPTLDTIDLTGDNIVVVPHLPSITDNLLSRESMADAIRSAKDKAVAPRSPCDLNLLSKNKNATLTNTETKLLLQLNEKTFTTITPSLNSDQTSSSTNPTKVSKPSWAERWLDSKDVKKVVSTSKMYTHIRKRMMQQARQSRDVSATQSSPSEVSTVVGSVEEYQNLSKQLSGVSGDGSEMEYISTADGSSRLTLDSLTTSDKDQFNPCAPNSDPQETNSQLKHFKTPVQVEMLMQDEASRAMNAEETNDLDSSVVVNVTSGVISPNDREVSNVVNLISSGMTSPKEKKVTNVVNEAQHGLSPNETESTNVENETQSGLTSPYETEVTFVENETQSGLTSPNEMEVTNVVNETQHGLTKEKKVMNVVIETQSGVTLFEKTEVTNIVNVIPSEVVSPNEIEVTNVGNETQSRMTLLKEKVTSEATEVELVCSESHHTKDNQSNNPTSELISKLETDAVSFVHNPLCDYVKVHHERQIQDDGKPRNENTD